MCNLYPRYNSCCGVPVRIAIIFIAILSIVTGAVINAVLKKAGVNVSSIQDVNMLKNLTNTIDHIKFQESNDKLLSSRRENEYVDIYQDVETSSWKSRRAEYKKTTIDEQQFATIEILGEDGKVEVIRFLDDETAVPNALSDDAGDDLEVDTDPVDKKPERNRNTNKRPPQHQGTTAKGARTIERQGTTDEEEEEEGEGTTEEGASTTEGEESGEGTSPGEGAGTTEGEESGEGTPPGEGAGTTTTGADTTTTTGGVATTAEGSEEASGESTTAESGEQSGGEESSESDPPAELSTTELPTTTNSTNKTTTTITITKESLFKAVGYVNRNGLNFLAMTFIALGILLLVANFLNSPDLALLYVVLMLATLAAALALLVGVVSECATYHDVCVLKHMDWFSSFMVTLFWFIYIFIWAFFVAIANTFANGGVWNTM